MKMLFLFLAATLTSSAFAATCPLSNAIDAAKDEYTAENFGEQGAEKSAHYAGLTKSNKQQFFVTIDGTDGGNGITSFVVYLDPATCQPTDKPKPIKEN